MPGAYAPIASWMTWLRPSALCRQRPRSAKVPYVPVPDLAPWPGPGRDTRERFMTDTLLSVRVAGKSEAAQGIVSLKLISADGGMLPAFTPGAHIDVHLPGGLIRQYSLMSDCQDRSCFRLGILREPQSRGGSIVLHDR